MNGNDIQQRSSGIQAELGKPAFRWDRREWLLLAVVILLALLFGLTNPHFLTVENLLNILNQSTIILLVSLGMLAVIVSGGIDLSVGALASLVGVVTVVMMNDLGIPAYAAILLGLVTGGFVGLLNGFSVSRLKIPDFISTLAMMSICRGAAFLISGGYAVRTEDRLLVSLYNEKLGPLTLPIVVTAAAAILMFLFLGRTRPGRSMYAVGGNRHAALLMGIHVQRTVLLSYSICGFLTAAGGILTASRIAAGSPTAGMGWELTAISIVVLGGASLFGGQGGVLGTVLAAILLGMINNWLSLTGMAWWLQGFVQGALLILVVALNRRILSEKLSSWRSGMPASGER